MQFIGLFWRTFCVQVSMRNVFLYEFSSAGHTSLPFSNILYYTIIINNEPIVRVTTTAYTFRVNLN